MSNDENEERNDEIDDGNQGDRFVSESVDKNSDVGENMAD